MILESLVDLAAYEELLGDPDLEMKPVAFLVELSRDGSRHVLRDTRYVPNSEKERKKPRRVAKQMAMPREAGRTSGDRALFLFDKAEYLFGIDPDGKRPAAKLELRARLFRERVGQAAAATGDSALQAAVRFLADIAAKRRTVELPEDVASNDLFALSWAPDIDLPMIQRPAVLDQWRRLRARDGDGAEPRRCLVTGELAIPADKHTILKGIPGASSAGVPLVSFNQKSFESYGLSGNDNAPVSRAAAEAYATALARLLAARPVRPNGESLGRRNVRISADTVVCFWAHHDFADAFGSIVDPDPDVVVEVYRGVWRGEDPRLEDPTPFFALTLTGSLGRVMVRGYLRSTVGEVAGHLAEHFADLHLTRLTPPPKNGGHPPSFRLQTLLAALAPLGKGDDVPAALGQGIVDAVLTGGPYPYAALGRALVRERAEIHRDGWGDKDRRDARRALIKAVLERRRRFGMNIHDYPALGATMDPENTQPGYLLGRLMAVIERLQQTALGDVNASVVDRYFGAASATPKAVFVRLLKNARNHARKAKDSSKSRGYAIHLESQLDAIADRFDPKDNGFPAHLDLEQQGLFVLGYHQQRHAFFAKKSDTATPNDSDPATPIA
ncbi:MAG: type I-C CRISPR-associated protein Cas8c/Csd1 [Acidobacteriota bacterium]